MAEKERQTGKRWRNPLLGIAAIVLVGAAAWLGLTLVHEVTTLRRNTDVQRDIMQEQLALAQRQQQIAERQLEISEESLDIAREQLGISRTTLDIARQQLGISQRTLTLLERQDRRFAESLAIQREALEVARRTEAHAREINEKTPESARLVP